LPQTGRALHADIAGLQTESQPQAAQGEAADLVDAGHARKASQARQEDVTAGDQAARRQPLAAAPDASAAANPHIAEKAVAPDFAKLLAGREAAAPTMLPAAAMQTAAVNATTAMTANVIEPRLGSRDWSQAVSQKVVWMVGAMEQSATLTLNPPDLGPLQVVIQVHNDQADAAFMSDNPDVRQALQDSLGTLRSMMNSSGIQLGDASISAGGPGQEQLQQQFQQSQRQAAADGRTQADPTRQTRLETPIARQGSGSGLVDTFA
jgi:flagellar hook-length control protein FliK